MIRSDFLVLAASLPHILSFGPKEMIKERKSHADPLPELVNGIIAAVGRGSIIMCQGAEHVLISTFLSVADSCDKLKCVSEALRR